MLQLDTATTSSHEYLVQKSPLAYFWAQIRKSLWYRVEYCNGTKWRRRWPLRNKLHNLQHQYLPKTSRHLTYISTSQHKTSIHLTYISTSQHKTPIHHKPKTCTSVNIHTPIFKTSIHQNWKHPYTHKTYTRTFLKTRTFVNIAILRGFPES